MPNLRYEPNVLLKQENISLGGLVCNYLQCMQKIATWLKDWKQKALSARPRVTNNKLKINVCRDDQSLNNQKPN